MSRSTHQSEVDASERFEFGRNWRRFLATIDHDRIELAQRSLVELLGGLDLTGRRFIDAGSGSGLFSLAARRLGATVVSFDFDPNSVACTEELKRRYYPDDSRWQVETGSVLDDEFVTQLGRADVVYSWGVVHHTGAMWQALERLDSVVADDGLLAIAVYNDQGRTSETWLRIKQLYNGLPKSLRWIVTMPCFFRLWGPTMVRDTFKGAPLSSWRDYAAQSVRGMSPWHDLIDWVGGLPFEVAKPEELLTFYQPRGYSLIGLKTCAGGIGCNEFLFRRTTNNSPISST